MSCTDHIACIIFLILQKMPQPSIINLKPFEKCSIIKVLQYNFGNRSLTFDISAGIHEQDSSFQCKRYPEKLVGNEHFSLQAVETYRKMHTRHSYEHILVTLIT